MSSFRLSEGTATLATEFERAEADLKIQTKIVEKRVTVVKF
jgi:hypothetical protein